MSTEGKNRIDGRLLRRIITYLAPYKGWVAIASVTVITAAFLGPLRPKLVQLAIDNHIVQGDIPGLHKIIIWLFVVLFAEGVLSFANAYLTQWIGQQAIYDLRTKVYRHIQRQSLTFFDRNPVGRLITRVTSDVESLSNVLSAGIVTILGDLFKLVFIAYFMFTLSPRLALVTLAVLPIMMAVTFWFRAKVREQYRETRAQVARLNSFLQEHVTGMKIVQLFGREKRELVKFDEINEAHRGAQIKTIFYFALFWPAIDITASTALGLVIWTGGVSAISSTLSLGVLIAFIQYARQFFDPVRNLSDQYNTLQSAMAGAERIFDLLDDDASLPIPDKPSEMKISNGEIVFQNVWFSYDLIGRDESEVAEPNWVLRDVSFRVDPGQSMAIVGATGAGKSTIINLLMRFYDPQKGSILLDGVDIREADPRELRRAVGLVLQEVFLFSGSVERNISLGDESVSKEDIRRTSKLIGADRFIDRLPGGWDYEVQERGLSLSHGQRQMLSFIRALIYNPVILVLDEATSSVDSETESAIQHALETMMAGRTSVVIAHRLSTIRHADLILVMHRGEVREMGNHDQLMRREEGLYRKLYELQYLDESHAA